MDAKSAIDRVVRDLEGGYSNEWLDRGGATKWGIIQTVYNAYRLSRGLPTRSVVYLEPAEMYAIYTSDYWVPTGGGKLPDGLDYMVFQAGVNIGPQSAVKILQRVLGVTDDGIVGPKTLAAVAEVDQAQLIRIFLEGQRAYYDKVVARHPEQVEYIKGWNNRVSKVASFLASYVGEHKTLIGLGLFVLLAAAVAAKTLK